MGEIVLEQPRLSCQGFYDKKGRGGLRPRLLVVSPTRVLVRRP